MLQFKDFYHADRILEMLCKYRVKLASRRNKDHLIHLHTAAEKHNYHQARQGKNEELLCSFFPPRKKWKTVVKEKRINKGQRRNTSEKTMISLHETIRYYRKHQPDAPFFLKLDAFILEIQRGIEHGTHTISAPTIIPQPKEDKLSLTEENVCRPIASFGLKDKLILSITNRYLTQILDPFFLNSSYAFRYKRLINGEMMCPTHHEPVQEILDFRERYDGKKLYVAECDMKKFFDTVHHSLIKKIFKGLFQRKGLTQCPSQDLVNAKRILMEYLAAYAFTTNVIPLNQQHFDKKKIPKGQYGWVEAELIKNGYYKRPRKVRIGIPQGGALSGLIANAVLHGIDRKVHDKNDSDLLYLRFCDDMIIIHPNQDQCSQAFERYLKGLQSRKLVIHSPVNAPYSSAKLFWKEKSKNCYQWGGSEATGSPWIGFVGYEIHHQGDIRVRKRGLRNEMKKQFKVMGDLKLILKDPKCRSSETAIYESAANRLIGMSVGRVNLWNYKNVVSEMCWVSGYRLLTDNKHTRIQLKRLDASRSRLLAKLRRKIARAKTEKPDTKGKKKKDKKPGEPIYYGYPFSYYHHALKKKAQ